MMGLLWKDALDHAAIILGIAISAYTIYSIIHSHIERTREFRLVLEEFRLEFEVLLQLISILSVKAENFQKLHFERPAQGDQLRLSMEAKAYLKLIEARAQQILTLTPKLDLPRSGIRLSKKQLDLLIAFLESFRLYRTRLELRLQEYQATPDSHDVLARFISSAELDENTSDKFMAFKKSLAHKPSHSGEKSG
jgi:hypothetical protein